MTITNVRLALAGGVAASLVVAGALLPVRAANAQSQAEQLLRQVLPGVTGGSNGDLSADGERACERFAEGKGLDVRRVVGTRQSGSDRVAVTLSVEDRNDRYETLCIYDGRDREVVRLASARDRRGDGAPDDQLAERARDACEDAAMGRDLDDVDVDDVRAKTRDTVEVTMRAEDRGERLDITCLYDDDERQAFLPN